LIFTLTLRSEVRALDSRHLFYSRSRSLSSRLLAPSTKRQRGKVCYPLVLPAAV
jgi:hypothetical protein